MREVFDSAQLPPSDRLDAYHALMLASRMRAPTMFATDQATDARDGEFRAVLRAMELGAQQVSTMRCTPMRARRTPRLIRQSDPESYAVTLVQRGHQGVEQVGRQALVGERDLVVYSTSLPFDAQAFADGPEPACSVLALVPQSLVPLPPERVEGLLAVPLSGREGVGALLAGFLDQVTASSAGHLPGDGPRLGTVLVDLVTALLAHHLEAEESVPAPSQQNALFLEIQAFVQEHLGDPGLSPGMVAAAHHISVRGLHRLFRRHGRTVSAWIRQQRLDRCRSDLAEPALHLTPVHELAARWGFTDAASFSRTFRATYGVPPGEYRHQVLLGSWHPTSTR
ncbi:helix-turn-helix domain-containing protein [Actinopolymorpha pittospori]|uniref:AraC-like DNA-binding protein n=1 Tax=Actinopolymorpha pittospori TaxID=648752 RepID=A0A927MQA1_9ACTN|nr:helix-turn-helix domain-containing protein [Actinopolymorpha pittospori]MBE1604911.1 AraC-like DNA-binding protein [Actinopolymorpha pittospori]